MWLQWQRLNTPDHRERLDAGARLDWRWAASSPLPLQTHIVHEGGQLYASGPVRDSFVLASRNQALAAGGTARSGSRASSRSRSSMGRWSSWASGPTTCPIGSSRRGPVTARAFFGRAAVEGFSWRAHLIMWRGDDYLKDEGDPNYQSIRRDGTRWRGVQDYAETGVTKRSTSRPAR